MTCRTTLLWPPCARAAWLLALAVSSLSACGYPDGPYEMYWGNASVRPALNYCPQFLSYQASPLATALEGEIQLRVEVEDLDGEELVSAWQAESGEFSDPEALETSYVCRELGEQELRLRTSDGVCERALSIEVACIAPPAPDR